MSPARMYSLRAQHALEECAAAPLRRSSRPWMRLAARGRLGRSAHELGRDAIQQMRSGLGLRHREHAARIQLVDQRAGRSQRKGPPGQVGRAASLSRGSTSLRDLVAEEHHPAAANGGSSASLRPCAPRATSARAFAESRARTGTSRCRVARRRRATARRAASAASMLMRLERPFGGAVEQHGIAIGKCVGEPAQHAAGHRARGCGRARSCCAAARSAVKRRKIDRAVGAAEAEGIRQRDVDLHRPRRVRHVVEIALRIGRAVVDRRRRDLVANARGSRISPRPHPPRRADGRSWTWWSSPPACCAWSPKARLIAIVSALSPSGVEVACALTYCTSAGLSPRVLQRVGHGEARALAVLRRRGDVIGVAAHAEADQLGVDARAALLRVLELLEDDRAAAVAEHEAVAVLVPGPARSLRRIVVAWTAPSPGRSCRGRRPSGGHLAAAGDHHVRIAVLDGAHAQADAHGWRWCRP